MAASVTSARDGMSVFARDSSSCVAQIKACCRLADPQTLFLHFGHPLESRFDRQTPRRDHHAESLRATQPRRSFGNSGIRPLMAGALPS